MTFLCQLHGVRNRVAGFEGRHDPLTRVRWKASSASSSVAATYSARPISFSQGMLWANTRITNPPKWNKAMIWPHFRLPSGRSDVASTRQDGLLTMAQRVTRCQTLFHPASTPTAHRGIWNEENRQAGWHWNHQHKRPTYRIDLFEELDTLHAQ